MLRLAISLLFLSCLAFCGVSARASGLRIEILADADVRGDSISLGNLLPESAPRLIRDAAKNVSLGAAPQNGATRSISRSTILSAIDALGLPDTAFLIPDTIVVRRAAHLVTREEAFGAIERALSKSAVSELPAFRLDDVSLDAAVLVPQDNPELEVTQITFDEFLGCARFRLWSKSAPTVHPFYVTARIPSSSEGKSGLMPASFAAAAGFTQANRQQLLASPVLVDTRQSVRLYLHSTNSSMLLEVKPLQRGRLGDTIRVRLPNNGRTLLARVTGAGSVEASF